LKASSFILMKKQTIALVIGIMFLGLASAMYAGNCQEVYLDFDNLDNVTYTSIGNQSDLEGLNVTLNGSYINICPVLNYKPDSFTLIFWDNSVKEVIKEVLQTTTKLLAPFAPYISDYVFQNFSKDSIHLSSWPKSNSKLIDKKLEDEFDVILQTIEKGFKRKRQTANWFEVATFQSNNPRRRFQIKERVSRDS